MFYHIYWPQFWYALFLPRRILSGPFAGMRYGRLSTGSVVLPKLIGTYESELHDCLASLPVREYGYCVDVGAGEGYYAVGLCWKFPHLKMTAFEQSARGRRRIRALADQNGVRNRILINGRCGAGELQNALNTEKRCFLIVDVEGFEDTLMDIRLVPALEKTDFIVEVHPERDASLGEKLLNRFEQTHDLTIIRQQNRSGKFPAAIRTPACLKGKTGYLMNEFRGPQFWIFGMARRVS